jgi:hypothetical protein
VFTGKLTALIMSALRWWLNRADHVATTRRRWDRLTSELARGRRRHSRPYWWNAPTVASPQVGRAGHLTPAQTWRANGGRWMPEPA